MKKLVVAQKTALGQVQVNTILVRSDNELDVDDDDDEEDEDIAGETQDGGPKKKLFGSQKKPTIDYESLSREDRKLYEMHKYLKRKGRARTHGRKVSHQLQNGVPCKLDVRGNAILDPLT